jgi:hydrogenase/urease accessory protein HupE
VEGWPSRGTENHQFASTVGEPARGAIGSSPRRGEAISVFASEQVRIGSGVVRGWLSILLSALLWVVSPAWAHPVPFSYLDLRLENGALEASLVVHRQDVAHELGRNPEDLLDPDVVARQAGAIAALVASRVELAVDGRRLDLTWSTVEALGERDALRLASRTPLAEPGRLALKTVLFPYDPAHQTFVNVYEGGRLETQSILDRRNAQLDYFSGNRQGLAAVAEKFLPAGVWHILVGADHVAFLAGLLLLGGTLRRLALVASAFTVAHSITLSLAVLELVAPSPRVIEPAIALSIICVGVDNLVARGGRDLRAWMALAFGLIHGFGFAGVLRAMDLPRHRLGWSLFFFNVGVELGQLVILLAVAPALAALRKRSERAARRLAVAGSIAVIVAGTFWFVERLVFSPISARNPNVVRNSVAWSASSDKK